MQQPHPFVPHPSYPRSKPRHLENLDISHTPASDQLSISGSHARLFDDDPLSSFINSPDALLPWNGDHSLLIDRYDVRHLLQDLSGIRRRRPPPPLLDVTEEELEYERFRDLEGLEASNVESEGIISSMAREYQSVPFSYSGLVLEGEKHMESGNGKLDFHPPFPVPDYLLSKLPPSQKFHQIIAGTAKFVSEHGGQSEIILRVKQGDNPMFGFLIPNHRLHDYFRFLVNHPELVGGTHRADSKLESFNVNTSEGLSLLGTAYGSGDEEEEEAQTSASLEEEEKSLDHVQLDAINNHDHNVDIKEAFDCPSSYPKPETSSTELPVDGIRVCEAVDSNRIISSEEQKRPLTLNFKKERTSPSSLHTSSDHVRPPSQGVSRSNSGVFLSRGESMITKGISKSSSNVENKKMKIMIGKNAILPNYNKVPVTTSTEATAAVSKSDSARVPASAEFLPYDDENNGCDLFVSEGEKKVDYGMTVDAAAAVVMAATRGLRRSKRGPSAGSIAACSGLHDRLSESSLGGESEGLSASEGGGGLSAPSRLSTFSGSLQDDISAAKLVVQASACGSTQDNISAAKAIAQAAALVASQEADSADNLLTPAEKQKAERLRRAKMFAAMIKSGQIKPGNNSDLGGSLVGISLSSKGEVAIEPVVSGSTQQKEGVCGNMDRDVDSQNREDRTKASISNDEHVAEVSSLKEIANGTVKSKHRLSSKEYVDGQHQEQHYKKRKSHHSKEDEDKTHHRSKRSHHGDGSDSRDHKKKSRHDDDDDDDRSHHKQRRTNDKDDSRRKEHHKTKLQLGIQNKGKGHDERKSSHHNKEGETKEHRHGHRRQRQLDERHSDLKEEKQKSGKHHRRRSLSPSDHGTGGKESSSKRHKHKETKERDGGADYQQGLDVNDTFPEKDMFRNEDLERSTPGPSLPVEDIPDDIRAKVRAMLLLNSV